jgi:hypothetical protein
MECLEKLVGNSEKRQVERDVVKDGDTAMAEAAVTGLGSETDKCC